MGFLLPTLKQIPVKFETADVYYRSQDPTKLKPGHCYTVSKITRLAL